MTASAVNAGDRAHAMLPAFERRVASALARVEEAAVVGKLGVSFSTGKDSTVVLDLVRHVVPDAPAAYFHSGDDTEYDENLRLIRDHYPDVDVIHTEQTMLDLMRNYGALGRRAEVRAAEVAWAKFLVGEPAMRFTLKHGIVVTAMGLRGQESNQRRMTVWRHGYLYRLDDSYYCGREHWHLLPIADWTTDDVWAYIASRELPYNPIYDRMAEVGIPRNEWRVSLLVGACGSNIGRYARLRMIAPDKFSRLAAEFPHIWRQT